MTSRCISRLGAGLAACALSAGAFLAAPDAKADVVLVEKDGWTVFMNGRMQTFFNYNRGDGFPVEPLDANGSNVSVSLAGGGLEEGDAQVELPTPDPGEPIPDPPPEPQPGKVEELRIRTGFVGNVLGFGIRNQISADTSVTGYTAVTTYIDSTNRRKYLDVRPDWRESYLKIEAPWGSVSAGRTLVLFNRGATEITYLYGFKYGLGWPGSISSKNGSGPGAGHVGFGVLGNGFGAGVAYATPVLAGVQLTAGLYDANTLPGSGIWERVRWPRPEAELTYEMRMGDLGMFKLFANGAYQKVYEMRGDRDQTMAGAGYGTRVEVGPVRVGLAGHYGKGVGMDFALQPHPSLWHPGPEREFRTVDGYYGQLMLVPTSLFDVSVGAGITRVARLDADKTDTVNDSDMDPATPTANDDANPAIPDSVGHIPLKQQFGYSAGVTFHLTDNVHVALEYFRAMFEWYKPIPEPADSKNPEQKFHVVNAGITYDF